jgi:uncharacterized protein HemX
MAFSAIDKLKDKPKDEKTAVAGGIAVSVVIVLLVGWAIYFFKSIENGSQQVNLGGGVQDQFNSSAVNNANQQLLNNYNSTSQDQQDLQDVRANAGSNGNTMQMVQQQAVQDNVNGRTDQFGNSTQ